GPGALGDCRGEVIKKHAAGQSAPNLTVCQQLSDFSQPRRSRQPVLIASCLDKVLFDGLENRLSDRRPQRLPGRTFTQQCNAALQTLGLPGDQGVVLGGEVVAERAR